MGRNVARGAAGATGAGSADATAEAIAEGKGEAGGVFVAMLDADVVGAGGGCFAASL